MALPERVVVGLGEVLLDCINDSRYLGGAPSNVAFHVQQMGHRGVICSRIGNDNSGRFALDQLRSHGLDTDYIQQDGSLPTGYVTVDASNPEHPSYVIHENVAWDNIEYTNDLAKLMADADAVCFGTLAQRSEKSRETIQRALSATTKALTVYDVNLRSPWYNREWIEWSLRSSRIVKLNSAELYELADLLGINSVESNEFSKILRSRFDVEITCITRGDKGCLVLSPDETVDIPGKRVEVVDTVGSGDAFTAAFIFGFLRGWSLEKTAEYANEVGMLVATRSGAMPGLKENYANLANKTEQG